jgi:hypothetical protein
MAGYRGGVFILYRPLLIGRSIGVSLTIFILRRCKMGISPEREVRTVIALNLLMFLLLFQGCAGRQLTPDQTYKWAMDIYAFHYNQYISQVASEAYTYDELQEIKSDPEKIKRMQVRSVSPEEKRILDKKWELLQDMDEALTIIREARAIGKAPPEDQMSIMINLGDKLIEIAGGI